MSTDFLKVACKYYQLEGIDIEKVREEMDPGVTIDT